MALAFQFNVPDLLNGTATLPVDSTKVPDDEGILVVQVPPGEDFGRFNPGELVTQRSAHYFLQSVQVTATTPGTMSVFRMLGRAPGGGEVVIEEIDLTAGPTPGYFDRGLVVPAGYELAFENDGVSPFLVRVTLWPLTESAEVITSSVTVQRRRGGGGGGGP